MMNSNIPRLAPIENQYNSQNRRKPKANLSTKNQVGVKARQFYQSTHDFQSNTERAESATGISHMRQRSMNSGSRKIMKLADTGRNSSMVRMVEEGNPYEQIVANEGAG